MPGVQPRLRAISAGAWRAALARRIWQRRRIKASGERKPACRRVRSESERVRRKVVTGLIYHYSHLDSLGKDLFADYTSGHHSEAPPIGGGGVPLCGGSAWRWCACSSRGTANLLAPE